MNYLLLFLKEIQELLYKEVHKTLFIFLLGWYPVKTSQMLNLAD